MLEIMDTAAEDGATLEAEARKEYDELEEQLELVDGDLSDSASWNA